MLPFYIDPMEFMLTLKEHCANHGYELFETLKPSGEDIMTQCPFHSDGHERKPSFGININQGVCHCFACGYASDIPEMISRIFGREDCGEYGIRWIKEVFSYRDLGHDEDLCALFEKANAQPRIPGFTEEELQKYRFYHPYMYKRGLTNGIIEDFDIGYDSSTNCITFPVYWGDGLPCFIARRSVVGKFFHYPSGSVKPVYAGERFVSGKYTYAVVVESIFNCLTFWRYGFPSVALLGTGNSYQYSVLKQFPVKKYILAFDPDPAGENGRTKFIQRVPNKLITHFYMPKGKDANDLGEQVKYLQEELFVRKDFLRN